MPTASSSSIVRTRASLRPMPRWARNTSVIWSPTVSTGLRLAIGSWKIIAISLPRTARSSLSDIARRSRPPNIAVPPATRPEPGRIPISASEVTLLPHPDSPTMPSVSPASTWKEMPLTACTVPRCVSNWTRRSSTSRSRSATAAQLRVERLAHRVADEVERHHDEDDRDPGREGEVRRGLQVADHAGQHRPPLRGREVRRPEPEEPETGRVDDRGAQGERCGDDHRRDGVREDLVPQDPRVRDADRPRGVDVLALPLAEDRPAHQPREDRDVDDPDREHHLEQ